MEFIKKIKKKRMLAGLSLLALLFVIVVGTAGQPFYTFLSTNQKAGQLFFAFSSTEQQEQKEFDTYLNQLFCQEVGANTINLHYTLKNPENYGIEEYDVTFGEMSEECHQASVAVLENIQATLEKTDRDKLTQEQQITYDILKEETETELLAKDLYYYQELLRPSTGIQAELPVLMAEYTFYDIKDIQDYLELLSQTPDYFKQIMTFEMEKANQGLFMSEFAAEDIISQCKNFIENPESNYLLDTFVDKVNGMEGLTEEEKESLIEQNEKVVAESVIPAYETMIQAMEKLKNAGKNQQGLCHLPKGKAYYEYLVQAYTGSEQSIEELQQATMHKRAEDLSQAAKLISDAPELLTQTTSYTIKEQTPEAILQELQEKMSADFPAPPDTEFTVKYVHPSLEEHMAPAFYLAVPIDDISQNSIYINGAHNYQDLKLYTTLAHEGFPGHLYQNIMERSQSFPAIRSMLGPSGYSEGWATYVEMISYSYAELSPQLAELLQKDQSALLSLYATADMGIHYDGWSLQQMIDFFGEYQITDTETLTEIYQLIVEEPAHYLKYYIGYLEFLDLKAYAEELYGDGYSDYKFHEALMKMGPAQFSVLKKHFTDYYEG